MKIPVIFATLLIASIVLTAPAFNQDSQQEKKTTTNAASVYTCPMHKDVKMSTPGKCPKCSMALAEVDGKTATQKPVDTTKTSVRMPCCDKSAAACPDSMKAKKK